MDDAKTVTRVIVRALASEPIAQANLSPDSVSSLALQVGEALVDVSWYTYSDPCFGDARQVLVNGEGLPVSSRQIAEIVRAAQLRSMSVQKEKLAFLAGHRPS